MFERLKMSRQNFVVRGGFTLIELLVVIALIAVLAAILFPVFSAARGKARQVVCLSNVRQLTSAMIQYASDYDSMLPYVVRYGEVTSWGNQFQWAAQNGYPGGPYYWVWAYRIYPYHKNWQIYMCPSANYARQYWWDDWGCMKDPNCWGTDDRIWQNWLAYGATNNVALNGWQKPYSIDHHREPARYVMLADSPYYGVQAYCSSRWHVSMPPTGKRHFEGINVTFFDGHAKWVRLDQAGSYVWWPENP
jgi:prepilin-type N-terminal cleavage/methylation domain-containing protein/prepilin-type processing-associated H-X9-DG protein